jgi:uncharacterized membrane protein YccC
VNLLVWVMMGIAIWHFAVFLPDRFWGGIVGAFVFAIVGAIVVGIVISAGEVDDAHLSTALEGIPGALIGLGAAYFIGIRREDPRLTHTR